MRSIFCMLFAIAVVALAIIVGRSSINKPVIGAGNLAALGYEGGTLEVQVAQDSASQVTSRQWITRRPRGPYIVIDSYSNRLFLRTGDKVILDALCSTGSGGELVDSLTGRRWRFGTPTGVFKVHSKLKNPWWRKPDWAFVEEGLPVPKNDSERLDNEMMGDYAIGFGDGYFIHGTIYERLLGKAVTHGCVRLGAEDLRRLYESTEIGMLIYVY